MKFLKDKNLQIIAVLILLLVATFFCSIMLGAVSLTLDDFKTALTVHDSKQWYIITHIRVPRTFAAIFAGMGLAASGAIIQTVFDNPLASPNIIGVNAGASFFVILTGAFFPAMYYIIPISAFCGAFFTAALIFLLGKKTGFSKSSLILAGLAVNSLFNSASDLLCNLNDKFIINNKAFRMGSLNGVNTQVLFIAAIAIATGVLITMMLHNELEVLSLGYETAASLGLPVFRYRIIFLSLSALLAGAAISFAGPIGFVGLIVPHIAKLLNVRQTKYYLFISAIMGALFVSVCDLVARLAFRPHEIPVGIIISFLGVPFFLYLLIKRKENHKHA